MENEDGWRLFLSWANKNIIFIYTSGFIGIIIFQEGIRLSAYADVTLMVCDENELVIIWLFRTAVSRFDQQRAHRTAFSGAEVSWRGSPPAAVYVGHDNKKY